MQAQQGATIVFRFEDFQEELVALAAAAEPVRLTAAEDAQQIEKNQREERLRLKQRLARHDRMCVRRPLSFWWRQGRFPTEKEILHGRALLKAYAIGLFVLYAVPRVSIRRRRLRNMAAEQAEDGRAVAIGTDVCVAWLGKLASLPLLSVMEDHGLRLNPASKELLWRLDCAQVKARAMKLKVRVRYILRTICEKLPPPGVLNMLQLLVTDGRYLPESYLFPHEQAVLERDEFGATRRMVFPITDVEHSGFRNKLQDRSRCRTLLLSHVFLKVLICRVILVPWSAGVCRLPNPTYLSQTVENLRHIASLVFSVVRLCDHNIPPLAAEQAAAADPRTADSCWRWAHDVVNDWLGQLLSRIDAYEELLDGNSSSGGSNDQSVVCDWSFLSRWLYPSAVYGTPELDAFVNEYRAVVSDWADRYAGRSDGSAQASCMD